MKEKSKVILLPCNSYREDSVYESLKRGTELLGGLDRLVKKEEAILLKPNLLKKAESGEYAAAFEPFYMRKSQAERAQDEV